MKLILRILLFILCISFLNIPLGLTEEFETLEKNYVQFEKPDNTPIDFSIIKTIEKLVHTLQNIDYSLLSWSTHLRDQDLQIENYHRQLQFGRWINDPDDKTCFNTRALVLLRDSDKNVVFKTTNHCSVDKGSWNDPYTGKTFDQTAFIQIDHVVPLKNAYMSGAYKWDFKTRCLYANYLGNDYHLLSVNASENMKKGDRSPDKYMPPNFEFTCTYLKNWLSIKFLWGLKMTLAESEAITALIKNNNCNVHKFRITDREMQSQSQFFQSKKDLCEKLDEKRDATNKFTEN